MACYKTGGCGVYENRSCSDCPASKPEYVNKPLYNASIWQELADLKRRIPRDTEIYKATVRYDNFLGEHRAYFYLTEWSDEYLGLIDAPLSYSHGCLYGFYTTKERAIQAVEEKTRDFPHPVKFMN